MLNWDDRPWGRWEEYLNGPDYRVKRLSVHPGKRLSLQAHRLRSEYWVVVQGQGKLILDETERRFSKGETVFIPLGVVHRVENDGQADLVIIETQLGTCLEDDIVRLHDDWDRI
jgi:mannose-6-phosphate isomerase-like protein (cupin superfamily)